MKSSARPRMPGKARSIGWRLALAGALTSGCGSFQKLGQDLEKLEGRGELRVEIINEEGRESAHLAYLFHAESGRVADIGIVKGSGAVVLRALPGRYLLGAFEDRNENTTLDPGELARFHGDRSSIEIGGGAPPVELTLRLRSSDADPSEADRALVAKLRAANPDLATHDVGRRASLDDRRFSAKYAEMALWRPAVFLERRLDGLYMLEDYDPERVPVLFVHGMGGSPREFAAMVESLDPTRFQAWVFSYPSALRLAELGNLLNETIHLMRDRYDPAHIVVVAHSLGGLVAHEALQQAVEEGRTHGVCLLVTLASPMGGMGTARLGVDRSPTVMPAWYDLVPGSPFQQQLFRQPLEGLPYHLFFAYRRSGLMGSSGDGVIPLNSQLARAAQQRADRIIGIDASHVGVLEHPHTLEELDRLLQGCGER